MEEEKTKPAYVPDKSESEAQERVLKRYTKGRSILDKSYNQLNGRNIKEAVDDWTKRWNGYIPEANPLLDTDQSRIFLNFTRNQVIQFLSNIALTKPRTKVKAVNRKTGSGDPKFAEVLEDLLDYSSNEENGDARFLEAALEATTKGTVIIYEGYARNVQKMEVPLDYDVQTGKIKSKKEDRVVFDNCFQKIVPLEDFFIANPYQPLVQKQPFVIWREITTYDEAEQDFGDYKNWKYVVAGNYMMGTDTTTFYRNSLMLELSKDQVEIIRYYEKSSNQHIVLINGVVIYDGPIPFKDGNYPFAKGIFEPYGTDFFWGAGFPQKIMGEQDLLNTFWNMMVDKTMGSLLPFGMSSDLDDWIEDDTLALNRIRKVGDINKWRWDTLPGVSAGEQQMLQTALNFARENAGISGGAMAMSPRGGKLNVRQVLLQQQEAMKMMGFPMSFLEDMERDRVDLRLKHILQFYSIPKIEKISGKNGKEIEKLAYRDVRLSGVKLHNGKIGNKVINLIPKPSTPDQERQIADNLSITEAQGDITGTPTEALALSVDSFYDYNLSVQVIKASSYEKNAALDQAARMEYANWRLSMAQAAPIDAVKLVDWVSESFDIDPDEFKPQQQMMPGMGQPGQTQPGQPQPGQVGPPGMGQPGPQPIQRPAQPKNALAQIQPSSMSNLSNNLGV